MSFQLGINMRTFTLSAAAAAIALTLATGGQIVGVAFTAPAYAQTAQQSSNIVTDGISKIKDAASAGVEAFKQEMSNIPPHSRS